MVRYALAFRRAPAKAHSSGVTITKKCRLGGIGFAASIPDYGSIFGLTGEYDTYLFCLKCVLIFIANIAENNRLDVRFWVEEGPVSGRAYQQYLDLKAVKEWKAHRRMASFKSQGKKVIGLQAADLMAREAFKFMYNIGSGRDIRKPLLRMADRITLNGWHGESLRDLKENWGTTNRDLIEYLSEAAGTSPLKRLAQLNYRSLLKATDLPYRVP
jgi:hypothetical protein